MKRGILFLALGLIVLANPSLASDPAAEKGAEQIIEELKLELEDHPEEPTLLRDIGILYHNLGAAGDRKAVEEAFSYLEKSYQLDSEDPLTLGYLGSTETLKARDSSNPANKIRFVKEGIKKMDKAIKMVPDEISLRLLRANNSLGLPSFFHRDKVAKKDFEYLLHLSEEHPERFDNDTLGGVYLGLASVYEKEGDILRAREFWEKVIEVNPDSTDAEEAERMLKLTAG